MYVDDFIIAGNTMDKHGKKKKDKIKKLYKWGNGKLIHLHFAESTTYRNRITQSNESTRIHH